MTQEDKNIDGSILKILLIISVVASFIITVFTRLNIDSYVKLVIVPIMVVLGSYTIFVNSLHVKLNKKAYIYLAYILLVLNSYFIVPIAEINKYLNIIIVPILTSIYIFKLINPNYTININVFKWFVKFIPGYLFSNTEYIEESIKEFKGKDDKFKDVIKGLIIGIPLLAILLILLTKADKYFSSFIGNIFSSFNFEISIDTLYQIGITIALSFIFIFSTCINIYQNRKNKDFERTKITVSNIMSYIILSLVNLVYVLYLVSEISKLTTNFLNVPIEYTYAEYAREGFFELLGVSTINFVILIFYLNFVSNLKDKKYVKYLLLSTIVFSIFIICNSYYRMGLYIFEYGFTVLRLQVILFLALELIFFGFLTLKLNNKLKNNNNLKYLLIMLIIYFLNIYLCNDLFVNFINDLWGK